MTILTLSDDQARMLAGSAVPVIVVDSRGRPMGQIAPVDLNQSVLSEEEEIAEAKRRMATDDDSGRELSEVIAHLSKIAPP
jgi:hypothetical protein